ncbi:MAG: zf-HC2 domain-containing protein [Vicinamibacterales bacterium]
MACDAVRDRLEAFHDGELGLEEQLLVREHLDTCVACALERDGLDSLRVDLRDLPGDRLDAPPDSWTGAVLEQAKVERQLSWHTWLLGVFDDMHLVWPALGATAAVLVCLLASAEVMQATNDQRPDSLAGVIGYLASPGSNLNPARIDGFTEVPRRHESDSWPLASEDAVLTLSAVVTREGRIQNVEMLAAEQARALKVKPEVVLAMLDAASRAQFEPARAGGAPIAVSMVWLLAHTTVVAREADMDRLWRPLSAPAPAEAQGPERPRRVRS